MEYWIRFEREDHAESSAAFDEAEFNLCFGLEPMRQKEFDYFIKSFLEKLYKGKARYLSIGYNPHRPDGVSAIQMYRPHVLENDCSVEIVVDSDNARGFTIYCRKQQTLEEAINWFRKVLVDYERPNLSDWIDITDICSYVDVNGDQ